MNKENIIQKYTTIIVIDGKTAGIRSFQVEEDYKTPYVKFETTSGYTFTLTPSDAKQVLTDIEEGNVVYIKMNSASLFDSVLHWHGITSGLNDYD